MLKARLIITNECSRGCKYCCNQQPDLNPIPINKQCFLSDLSLANYDEVIISGGEPAEYADLVGFVKALYKVYDKPIYLYTARYTDSVKCILPMLSGITYTLHDPYLLGDVNRFVQLQTDLLRREYRHLSARLIINQSITKDINIKPCRWDEIKIFKFSPTGDCPLPKDEVLYLLHED